MKRALALLLAVWMLLCSLPAIAEENAALPIPAGEELIAPQWPVPDHVQYLLDTARAELGYTEGAHGYSKFGEYWGDPYAQWCAEFLCWCVDQVDKTHGTELLQKVYPLYSGQNTGKRWFIRQGRYVPRNGNLEDWGYQWFKDADEFLRAGDYIPQPGDWVFFTWTSDTDTDHVAMVEFCTRAADGTIRIHCIEGNNPVSVSRAVYDQSNTRILGYGTVHDVTNWTMRAGNAGEKVRALQERMIYLGLLPEGSADGVYGASTAEAIRAYQMVNGLKINGIANLETQRALEQDYLAEREKDSTAWIIIEEENWD